MKKFFLFNFLILLLICILGGCEKKMESNNTVEMTERQTEILKEEGLPIEYDKLSYTQKRAINRIEYLFQYLDKKYKVTFRYVGYIKESQLEDEQLIVYPENKTKQDLVKVTVDRSSGQEVINDDYLCIELKDEYIKYVSDFFINKYGISNLKVISQIEKIEGEGSSIDKYNISAINRIFIYKGDVNKDLEDKIAIDYQSWIEQHNLYGDNRIYIVREDIIRDITEYNFENYVGKDTYVKKYRCVY